MQEQLSLLYIQLHLEIWLRRAKGSITLSTKKDSSSDLMGSYLLLFKS